MAQSSTRSRLLNACYLFLVPVARFLLRNGISFTEFSDICRVAFVATASSEYGIRGRPTNISRVSAMTGVGRKEVRRIRTMVDRYADNPQPEMSQLSGILHRWYTSPLYRNKAGQPKALKLTGGAASFARLVRETAGDIPIGAIKVELTRCGAISEDAAGRLVAQRRHVTPDDRADRLITSLSLSLRALASTVAFNACRSDSDIGRIERFVNSEALPEDAVAMLRADLRRRITSFTEAIDDSFAKYEPKVPATGRRIGVGVFFFEDD
jgi:hypothetical protein